MLSRRRFGKAAVMGSFGAAGGLPPQRPDQRHEPSTGGLGAGPRSIGPQPFVVIFGTGPRRGLFVYSGQPALGNLIASINSAGGLDKKGNNTLSGVVNYVPVAGGYVAAQMSGGSLLFQQNATFGGAYTTIGQINTVGTALSFNAALAAFNSPVQVVGPNGPAFPLLDVQPFAATDAILAAATTLDAHNRVVMNGNGSTSWGDGTNLQDVNLQRNAAGVLKISASGGGTVAALEIQEHSAPPTPSGGGRIYVDGTGHLHYLGPAGTDTIIANP